MSPCVSLSEADTCYPVQKAGNYTPAKAGNKHQNAPQLQFIFSYDMARLYLIAAFRNTQDKQGFLAGFLLFLLLGRSEYYIYRLNRINGALKTIFKGFFVVFR